MPKQYFYDCDATLVLFDTCGISFPLKRGDIITLRSDGCYEFGSHVFKLVSDDTLGVYFQRVYTVEEQNRYDRIHEQAMIATLQGLIADGWATQKPDRVARISIDFADGLVKELKEREF